jgi:glycosyltransferase involved in cell wall biosynthesis
MDAVHNALDIATSSSYGEGLPNVIGEAMACGVPCVVTNVGDSAWLVGETGIIVPAQNPEALAKGWASCLEQNISELGRKARARIIEHYGVQQLTEQTEKAISSLLQISCLRNEPGFCRD